MSIRNKKQISRQYVIHFPDRMDLTYDNQPVPHIGENVLVHDDTFHTANYASKYKVYRVNWEIKISDTGTQIPVAHVYAGFLRSRINRNHNHIN